MDLTRTEIWRRLREWKILRTHKAIAHVCEDLINHYNLHPVSYSIGAKKQFHSDRIIWQYWEQGYDNVPDTVQKCLDSVTKYAQGFTIVRLCSDNLHDYLSFPDFIESKRSSYSKAHFADILRLMLLKTYGGIWLDATVLLSKPIPDSYLSLDFFVFRRDPSEKDKRYWENTYAYYFGWAKGFRVNMLNSIIIAKRGNRTVTDLCNYMLQWWHDNDTIPDYFFFQILFDVYQCKESFPVVSDCLPHYLQQSINDPGFSLMQRDEILATIPIHKLTYKKERDV